MRQKPFQKSLMQSRVHLRLTEELTRCVDGSQTASPTPSELNALKLYLHYISVLLRLSFLRCFHIFLEVLGSNIFLERQV